MEALAVVLNGPGDLAFRRLPLRPPTDADVVVDVAWSGISTGTERLLWQGRLPHFPGRGYPLVAGDVAGLSKLKGVGKKTAERIVLELKDKVGVVETWQDAAAGQVSAGAADAELALIALGYKQVDARKAVRKVLDADPAAATQALVRGALRALQG